MNRISAAEHHLIEFDETVWALLSYTESGDTRVELEARTEEPLTYSSAFATSRRLPSTLSLPLNYVWQVVLGWSNDDEAWHLGLLLASDLATVRGSRWCELARWPDPDPAVFEDLAQQSARGLSMVIDCPMNIIPYQRAPRPGAEVKAELDTRESIAVTPLPNLPLDLGEWSLLRSGQGVLQLKRAANWKRKKYLRIIWFTLWLLVYLALSILTLNSDLALPNAGAMLPNPEILPYLGLIISLILFGLIVYHVIDLLRQPDRIVFDGERGRVTALRRKKPRWVRSSSDLRSVYVTEIINYRGNNHIIYEQALNLFLSSNGFLPIFHQENKHEVDTVARTSDEPLEEAVIRLTRSEARTDMQAAGLYIVEELGDIPCYYDRRTR